MSITTKRGDYEIIRNDATSLSETLIRNTPMNLVIEAHGDIDKIHVDNTTGKPIIITIGDAIKDYIGDSMSSDTTTENKTTKINDILGENFKFLDNYLQNCVFNMGAPSGASIVMWDGSRFPPDTTNLFIENQPQTHRELLELWRIYDLKLPIFDKLTKAKRILRSINDPITRNNCEEKPYCKGKEFYETIKLSSNMVDFGYQFKPNRDEGSETTLINPNLYGIILLKHAGSTTVESILKPSSIYKDNGEIDEYTGSSESMHDVFLNNIRTRDFENNEIKGKQTNPYSFYYKLNTHITQTITNPFIKFLANKVLVEVSTNTSNLKLSNIILLFFLHLFSFQTPI